jgi:hypothetical protein
VSGLGGPPELVRAHGRTTAVRLIAALSLCLGAVAGCGRLGYDPALASQPVEGTNPRDGSVSADGTADQPRPAPEASPDASAVEPASDGPPPVDTAPPPVDTSPPVDTAPPPIDTALPPDAAPDVVETDPAMSPCVPAGPADVIADFEDGTLRTNRVGTRGGPTFHMVDVTLGTIANVALPFCGQRAMQMQPIGSPPASPLVQAHFMPANPDPPAELFDARGYRGISLALRASTPIAVRLKLPNGDTISNGGDDHFRVALNVGINWIQASMAWGAFRQSGSGTQYPSFDVSKLYALEISASLPAGATLWIDNIAFVR